MWGSHQRTAAEMQKKKNLQYNLIFPPLIQTALSPPPPPALFGGNRGVSKPDETNDLLGVLDLLPVGD